MARDGGVTDLIELLANRGPCPWLFSPAGHGGVIVNVPINGDEVVAALRAYIEAINFLGKAITLRRSVGPEVTVFDGDGLATLTADNQEDWA